MRSRTLPATLAGLAVAGLAISTYLTVAHWGGQPIACAGVGECDYVNSSEYADVAGLPVSLLGALLYGSMIAAATAWWLRPADDRPAVLYWGISLAGAGYALYLAYIELAVLHAICVWCVGSATILLLSLALATWALVGSPPSGTPQARTGSRQA